MPDCSSSPYEIWDLRLANGLLPSRLFHLEPINVGASLTESLVSYISRLAEAHSVSVGNLFQKEIKPLIGKESGLGYVSRSAINGIGIVAKNWILALER